MKAALLTAALFVFSLLHSQDVYFDWVKGLDRRTGLSGEEGYLIGVDAQKNVYLAGNFRNTMDLDPGPDSSNVNGMWDHVFVVKLDPSGNFVWGKNIGGDRFTLCRYLTVDPGGNVYLTGAFSGTTDFDPGPGSFNLTAQHTEGVENYDVFITKLDTDGNFQWAKRFGYTGADRGNAVDVDAHGNVYATGSFSDLTSTFLLKFDASGNQLWLKQFTTTYSSYGSCIKVDQQGNIYTLGRFEGTADFDPGPGTYNLTVPLYSRTLYLSKLNAAGDLLWVKLDVGGEDIAVDAAQNVFVYGGGLSKLDKDGVLLWTKKPGGRPATGYVRSNPICLDAAGNIYLAGEYHYTDDFDPGPGVYNMTVVGEGYPYDVFVCRLDNNGNFVWAKSFGSWGEDRATSLALDTSGNVYTTGMYVGQVDFDPGPAVFNLWAYSGGGIFIHKMSPCLNRTAATLTTTACTSYTLNGTTYTKSGTYYQILRNTAGCDSTLTLNLTLKGSKETLTATACDQYTWRNRTYSTSGVFSDTLTTTEGCDSILTLNLTVRHRALTSVTASICEGQAFEGYTASGTYQNSFVAVNGCDSIRVLNLTVKQRKTSVLDHVMCEGETYLRYKTSGTYIDTLLAVNGCDSIRTLHLLVNPRKYTTRNIVLCKGQSYYAAGALQTTTGVYRDTLVSQTGCDSVVTTNLSVNSQPVPRLGGDKTLCVGETLTLNPGSFATYSWQDGSTTTSFTVRDTGKYAVRVVDGNGCSGSDSMRVKAVYPLPGGFLPLDTAICSYGTLELRPVANYSNYLWSTGSRASSITISRAGVYTLDVVDAHNCAGRDTITVSPKQCMSGLYVPTAFTPNGDGKNDLFRPLLFGRVKHYQFTVFNRWGQVVFQSAELGKGWDGKTGSNPQESNVYVWTCTFQFEGEVVQTKKGTVVVIK